MTFVAFMDFSFEFELSSSLPFAVKMSDLPKVPTQTLRTRFRSLLPCLVVAALISLTVVQTFHQQHQEAFALKNILLGRWTLVDLVVAPFGLDGTESYRVQATFCEIDWDIYTASPSSYSFFGNLKKRSKLCPSTTKTFDLNSLVQKINAFDSKSDTVMKRIQPSGMIFHQSRCGSTLAANMLASFPHKARVYSEPAVTAQVLRACSEGSSCNPLLHTQLIRDVHTILGRFPKSSTIDHVFYKSNSGGLYAEKFAIAFPDTPWIYMFRNSQEILQSHWKIPEGKMSADEARNVKCSRLYESESQPPTMQLVLEQSKRTYASRTEYCAAYLAAISLAVLQEHARTGKGRFVNYQQMPEVMWETILPIDFGMEVEPNMIDSMKQLTKLYSKGHQTGRANEQWAEDSERKQKSITSNLTRAIETFCPCTYEQLERVHR